MREKGRRLHLPERTAAATGTRPWNIRRAREKTVGQYEKFPETPSAPLRRLGLALSLPSIIRPPSPPMPGSEKKPDVRASRRKIQRIDHVCNARPGHKPVVCRHFLSRLISGPDRRRGDTATLQHRSSRDNPP